jgi:RNA polymerase sigma-70 factor (ECF subfamily)
MSEFDSSTTLQRLLDVLRQGHDSARAGLIGLAQERLHRIAHHMLGGRRDLRGVEDTDDVLQKGMLRLHNALAAVQPDNVHAFFGLASRQIRWVLMDMARRLSHRRALVGPAGMPPSTHRPEPEPEDPEGEPGTLAEWTEFHQQIEGLPPALRDVFDLLWYQGLTQPEAARVLGLSLATVQRRWAEARVRLQRLLFPEQPGGDT